MSAKYTFVFVNRSEEVSYSFRVNDPSTVSRLVMSPHGQLTMLDWSDESGQWLLHWATPTSLCDVYSACGPFGLCDVASSQYCRCLPGFEPASPGDWAARLWSAGCSRRTTLQCSGNASSTDGFIPVHNVQLPSGYSPVADTAGSSGDCASACLRNCSCTAYAYRDGCLVWGGDLRNAQQLAEGDAGASTLFLRVAAADLATASHGVATNGRVGVAILCASCVIALAILCLLFVLAWLALANKATASCRDL
ncbi:hypothetical protein C2845_PM02G30930 [Panicum miliaceum]|uniref:Apple domain-containing protein n=1 Tax=Panicum miliaceum TaxID=4540 RepID=A0A3L6S7G8_PANMI|nr:hypothetical protein C2845_PM02G30930 [Panicum miliaceum]